MKLVIIGAGAIGGGTAAYLAKNNVDVTLVCKRQSITDAIKARGMHIIGKRGEHFIPLKAVTQITDLNDTFDVCLIATKAYDLKQAAEEILPYLNENGLIVSMQNGICSDILIDTVGKEHAAGCIVTWSCTQVADGLLDITGEGEFILGKFLGENDERINELKTVLDFTAPTRISENILRDVYSKLIINSGITCGGAMTGETLGKMLQHKTARLFFMRIVKEDVALANALGLEVPPFGGKLDYYRFAEGNSVFDKMRRHFILFAIGMKYRKLKSSSLRSLERGGKTEVDTLNGWISNKAKELGVPTPVNDAVVRIVKEIENGTRPITPSNLEETLAD